MRGILRLQDWPQIHKPCSPRDPQARIAHMTPWEEPDHSKGQDKQTCSITWTYERSALPAGPPASSAPTITHRCGMAGHLSFRWGLSH